MPAPLYGLMRGLLDNLKRGEAVTVLPHDTLLTTQQAAQILNVSRPYLYRLIDDNAVPVVMVGSHRACVFTTCCSCGKSAGSAAAVLSMNSVSWVRSFRWRRCEPLA